MSFPDPGALYMQPTPLFAHGGDSAGAWPYFPMNNEQFEQNLQFDQHQLPFKRRRNSEDGQPNSTPPQPRTQPPNPPVNKGANNIFYKTRMCAKFRMGTCRNGENCNFAHGIEDMRQPPPNWQELVGSRDEDHRSSANWEDDQRIIHRMKLCKKFYNGEECPYGERCNFLHEDPAKFRDDSGRHLRDDSGRYRESSVISIGTTAAPPPQPNGSAHSEGSRPATVVSDASRTNAKPAYWKTKLCTKWETTGYCPFGEKCHFAHGQAELQAPAGRSELETSNSVVISAKPLPVPSNDASPNNVTSVSIATANEDGQGKKCLLKWKGPKKIDRIYADWLDDMPLSQNLPNKVES